MKAIPINIEGIQFRSKLEARWYLFMKNLGWNIEYEPEIEGINGWIPDFLILGNKTKVLVEVKPFQTLSDFEGDYASQTIKKIENSIKNIKMSINHKLQNLLKYMYSKSALSKVKFIYFLKNYY